MGPSNFSAKRKRLFNEGLARVFFKRVKVLPAGNG